MYKPYQLVRGKHTGIFVVIAPRQLDNEDYYTLRTFDPKTGTIGKGDIALPEYALLPYAA